MDRFAKAGVNTALRRTHNVDAPSSQRNRNRQYQVLTDDQGNQLGRLGQNWQDNARLLHERNSVANANVYVLESGGRQLLAKTYVDNPLWSRCLLGYWGLKRECCAMRQLAGIAGVPRVYGVIGGHTLLMDFVDNASPLVDRSELTPEEYPPLVFFERLRRLVDEVHRRGIAHGDMRRMNILRDHGDYPHLIDFTTAIRWQRFNPLARILFRALRRADDFGVAKLQLSFHPDSLPEDEKRRILHKPWYLAIGRFLRKRVYRKWIKQRRWRERVQAWRRTASKQQD
jgi:serine/threonine protein kinase